MLPVRIFAHENESLQMNTIVTSLIHTRTHTHTHIHTQLTIHS